MPAPARLLVAAVLALGLLAASGVARAQAVLARDGTAALRVVLPHDPIPAERTAARELAEHLERASGARFEIVEEPQTGADGPAIFVGPTRFARRTAAAGESGPEDWRIRTADGSLVLDGGRPRGTLYAVYHFLEDVVGVRWWTPWDSDVPSTPQLVLEPLDLQGAPAFAYRDVHGLEGPPEFSARNRHNGDRSRLDWSYGGREAYGPPGHAHDFYVYVPPEEFSATHPEYFSEIDGERDAERGQLCLTNEDVRRIVGERLEANIERAEAEARQRDAPPPTLYPISQMDRGGGCECERCAAVDRRAHSHAGSLVEFLNDVAGRIARDYPEVLIDTLAYHYTFEAPRGMRLRDNVVVRLSALQRRDFSKPITHRRHRSYRRAIREWGAITTHLRVWDYSVTFGEGSELPLPNLKLLAQDFRYYREHGIEGVFIQHDGPVRSDMRDLKLWVLLKLLEDPYLDVDALVREFTDGYYGAAGESVRAYLALLEQALARRPSHIDYPARPEQYRYLSGRVLREGQQLFDRAEARVAGDPELLRRLRFARMSLDRATLLRWNVALRRSAAADQLDPRAVARRYWRTANEQIEQRLDEHRGDVARQRIAKELVEVMTGLGYSPPQRGRPEAALKHGGG